MIWWLSIAVSLTLVIMPLLLATNSQTGQSDDSPLPVLEFDDFRVIMVDTGQLDNEIAEAIGDFNWDEITVIAAKTVTKVILPPRTRSPPASPQKKNRTGDSDTSSE